MAQLIDADKIRAEIERRIDNLKTSIKNNCTTEDSKQDLRGNITTLHSLLSFLDTPEEPENPIYELNQILLNWVRDGQTDAEKDARWEAYQRFFELYDEAMMQEPEVDLEKKALNFGEEIGVPVSENFMRIARHFYELGKNAKK